MKSHRYKPGESRAIKERSAFLDEAGRCFACGATWKGLCCHEIGRGIHRRKAFFKRFCWLSTCWPCNQEMTRPAIWSLPRQLCLKMICDPVFYDLAGFNDLRGRPEGAIEQSEVDAYLDTVFQTYSPCET